MKKNFPLKGTMFYLDLEDETQLHRMSWQLELLGACISPSLQEGVTHMVTSRRVTPELRAQILSSGPGGETSFRKETGLSTTEGIEGHHRADVTIESSPESHQVLWIAHHMLGCKIYAADRFAAVLNARCPERVHTNDVSPLMIYKNYGDGPLTTINPAVLESIKPAEVTPCIILEDITGKLPRTKKCFPASSTGVSTVPYLRFDVTGTHSPFATGVRGVVSQTGKR